MALLRNTEMPRNVVIDVGKEIGGDIAIDCQDSCILFPALSLSSKQRKKKTLTDFLSLSLSLARPLTHEWPGVSRSKENEMRASYAPSSFYSTAALFPYGIKQDCTHIRAYCTYSTCH